MFDHTGRRTTLQINDIIIWDIQVGAVSVTRYDTQAGTNHLRFSSDTKYPLSFVTDIHEFTAIVMLLAESHNLVAERVDMTSNNPAFRFIAPLR